MDRQELKIPHLSKSDVTKLQVYTWVKDRKFRFVSCSENLAELAGEDSPSGMLGKDDFSLVWRKDASFFRKHDRQNKTKIAM